MDGAGKDGEEMKIRKITAFSILVLLLAAVVFVIPAIHAARAHAQRISCENCLSAIGKTFIIYGMDNGVDNHNSSFFPPKIAALCCTTGGSCYITQPKVFLCKGSQSHVGSLTNVDAWMDYIYIPWSTGTSTPPDYPVMYDRRLSNHQGTGINILWVDTSVSWDKGAKELKEFAAKHPDLHIPLPEDLK
jgi:hypothetical protein